MNTTPTASLQHTDLATVADRAEVVIHDGPNDHQSDIERLTQRIKATAAECDVWHASGQMEKYLAASCMLEALEQQLQQWGRQPRG